MPPNIVLFMTDSMDGRIMRHLGPPCRPHPQPGPPRRPWHLIQQRLLQLPQCAPSRASYWSGQYVHRVQAWNNPGGLPMDAPTFGTHLEDAGYGLHVFGKTDYRVGGHSLKARLTAWMRSANIKRPHNPRPQAIVVEPDTHVPTRETGTKSTTPANSSPTTQQKTRPTSYTPAPTSPIPPSAPPNTGSTKSTPPPSPCRPTSPTSTPSWNT